jgi:hypothetical protein
MKVKISYSVDIEEIPEKVHCLLDEVKKELTRLSDRIPAVAKANLHGEQYVELKQEIDQIRKKLFIADSKLEDSLLILDDWKRATLALEVENMTPPNKPKGAEKNVENSE